MGNTCDGVFGKFDLEINSGKVRIQVKRVLSERPFVYEKGDWHLFGHEDETLVGVIEHGGDREKQ